MLHVLKTSFRSNPNVGLYVYVTDGYCLVGPEVPDELYPRLAEVFEVPVHRFTIAGTGLLGVFLAGTNKHLLVPGIVLDRELRMLDNLKIAYTVIETDFTALGNNTVINDNGFLISEDYPDKDRKAMEEALGLKSKHFHMDEITVIGSCVVATSKGCIAHRELKDFEVDMIKSALKVPVTLGTVNLGNPYIKSSLAANEKGMIVGDLSGGPEIVNAEEALRGE